MTGLWQSSVNMWYGQKKDMSYQYDGFMLAARCPAGLDIRR